MALYWWKSSKMGLLRSLMVAARLPILTTFINGTEPPGSCRRAWRKILLDFHGSGFGGRSPDELSRTTYRAVRSNLLETFTEETQQRNGTSAMDANRWATDVAHMDLDAQDLGVQLRLREGAQSVVVGAELGDHVSVRLAGPRRAAC